MYSEQEITEFKVKIDNLLSSPEPLREWLSSKIEQKSRIRFQGNRSNKWVLAQYLQSQLGIDNIESGIEYCFLETGSIHYKSYYDRLFNYLEWAVTLSGKAKNLYNQNVRLQTPLQMLKLLNKIIAEDKEKETLWCILMKK